VIGCVPDQDPLETVSVLPTASEPATVGGAVFAGALVTTAVGADDSDALPALFVAVTTTRIVWPASAAPTAYVCAFAPEIGEHAPPVESQRRHANAYVIGAVPLQLPADALSVCPIAAVPEIAGGELLTGAAAATARTAATPISTSRN
jgi:hypothetical protein